MPSVSLKQRKFMRIAANNPEFAKANKIPQSVAQDFHNADKKKMRTKHRVHYLTGKTHAT